MIILQAIKVVRHHTNVVQPHAVCSVFWAETSPVTRWSQRSLPVAYHLGLHQQVPLKRQCLAGRPIGGEESGGGGRCDRTGKDNEGARYHLEDKLILVLTSSL